MPEALQDNLQILMWGPLTLLGRLQAAQMRDLLPAGASPPPGEATFEDAMRYHREGMLWEAAVIYRRLLKQQAFASLYEPYCRDLPQPAGSGLTDRRRVGFLVTQRHEGIFLRCMKGILERLDPDRFEVVLLCSSSITGLLRQEIRRKHLPVVSFPEMFTDAAERIRAAACDLIYFWEVGSDAMNYFLPFARLAPVQCTSHGSQITSGVPAVEHFFSSRWLEPEEAGDHYTERLWKSASLLMHQHRLPPVAPGTRGQFGLPEDRRLYVCLQNPLKIHPDMDPLLDGILSTDEQSLVVLLAGRQQRVAAMLKERFFEEILKTSRP